MSLSDRKSKLGDLIFRWRGHLPLLFVPILFLAAPESAHMKIRLWDHDTHIWSFICMAGSFMGLFLRAVVIGFAKPGTSGRNRHDQVAESLNKSGPYSIVRHPLYLGNFICVLGFLMSTLVWWVIILGIAIFWFVNSQMVKVEEDFLNKKFGAEYEQWAKQTPAFWPAFGKWKRPVVKFNWREVLSREYSGVLALGAVYLAWEAILDLYGGGQNPIKWASHDKSWFILFGICLVILLTLRTIRKKTDLLSQN